MFDSGFASRVAELHALAAELAAPLTAELNGPEAADALREAVDAGRQIELLTCRLMERVERTGEYARDGAASATAHLRALANERSTWAAKRVAVGRALADRLPTASKLWESGQLGLDHASVIDHATRQIEDPLLVEELDRILSEAAAAGVSPSELDRLASQVRAQAAAEESAAEAERQYGQQTLHVAQTFGGMWDLRGRLDAETGLFISKAIEAFLPPPPPVERRLADPAAVEPVALRRVHALRQLARHALSHAEGCNDEGGGRHTVVVATTVEQLRSETGAGESEEGHPVPAAALRRLACDANVLPLVRGSQSQVLDVGRRTRLISAALRHTLALGDGGCVFPGCDRPPSWCEAHHRQPWSKGGKTDRKNLDLFCTHHHHLIHESGWTYTPLDDETLEFHPPDGRPPILNRRRRRLARAG